jgi:hypothetical protein
VLAIERVALAEIPEEASTAYTDTQFQRSPNQALDYQAKLFLQGASQATVSLGRARAHWDRLLVRVILLDPTIQALLIARPRLSRALWTSWSKIVVALVSESQLIAVAPPGGRSLRPRYGETTDLPLLQM